jgi:hypothetical protein
MRWQVLLRPVGAEPLGVYWRRRFVVLAVVVIVVVILVLTLGGGSSKKATTTPGAHPSAAAAVTTPAGAPTSASAAVATPAPASTPCAAQDLSATAALSAHTYPAGAPVVVSITVRNAGKTACVLDTQPSQVQVSVKSGDIHNWANTDCGPVGVQPVPLAVGASHAITVTWTRLRSEAGCPSSVAAEQAAAGTYTVSVTVAGNQVAFAHLAAVFTLR